MEKDLQDIAGGMDLDRPNVSQIIALMRVLHTYTRQAIEEQSIDILMGFLYSHLSTTLQKINTSQLACRLGCSFCCNNWVTASTPEILHVLKAINGDRLEHVRTNIASAAQTTAGKSPEERRFMITPCPLLENSTCTIYESRPIVCRTAVSNDVAVCERIYVNASGEEIPGTFHHYGVKGIYGLALTGALKKAGLAPYYYEYNSALHAAMLTEGAEADWLSGRDVFSDIAHDPEGEMFRSLWNQKVYEQAFS
jgi:hypothetical protein